MLTRRKLLLSAAVIPAVFGGAMTSAFALSSEPLPADDAAAMALGCGGGASHAALIANARLLFDREVGQGLLASGYSATIFCPLCHCSLQVKAEPAL